MKYGKELGITRKSNNNVRYPSIQVKENTIEVLLQQIANLQKQLLEIKPPEVQKVDVNNTPEVQKVEVINKDEQKPVVFPEIQKVEITNKDEQKPITFPEVQKVEITNKDKQPEIQKVEITNTKDIQDVKITNIEPYPQSMDVKLPFMKGNNAKTADPTKYLPVRLTDGDKFYKALDTFYTAANGGGSRTKISNTLITEPFDYIGATYPDTSTEVYTYKLGGASGTLVGVITVVYTDSSKANILSVTKT